MGWWRHIAGNCGDSGHIDCNMRRWGRKIWREVCGGVGIDGDTGERKHVALARERNIDWALGKCDGWAHVTDIGEVVGADRGDIVYSPKRRHHPHLDKLSK